MSQSSSAAFVIATDLYARLGSDAGRVAEQRARENSRAGDLEGGVLWHQVAVVLEELSGRALRQRLRPEAPRISAPAAR